MKIILNNYIFIFNYFYIIPYQNNYFDFYLASRRWWLSDVTNPFLYLPLGFDTSILPICKDSLGWMFNRLDTNYDLLLDQSELGSIYLDKNEQCTKAFFNSCDTYKDSLISNNEWCYCFQRQQGKRRETYRCRELNCTSNFIYSFTIKKKKKLHTIPIHFGRYFSN